VPIRVLGMAACGLIYGQLILGAVVRHTGAGLAIRDFPLALGRVVPPLQSAAVALHFAHRVVALVIALVVAWIAARTLRSAAARRAFGGAAGIAAVLVVTQIGLGGLAVLTRLAVVPATLHVVNGALLLGACVVLTTRAWRGDRAARRAGRVGDYLALTKPRVTCMVLVTTAAGFYLGAAGPVDAARLALTLLGTLLVAAGTSALNQYAEREADARMLRTRARPLPAGRLAPSAALGFAIAISIGGLVVLAVGVNLASAFLAALTLMLYILAYTPLKKTTPLSTLVGALPGALPPLIGWAAASGSIAGGGLALFAILFLWQLPHSLAIARMYSEDYARGGFRLLPVVHPEGGMTERQILIHAIALLPVSLVPTIIGLAGPVYFAGALILGVGLAASAVPVLFDRSTRAARRVLLVSVVYLPVLLGLLAFDRHVVP
jgi:protoheme IX farnesyltransferase